MQDLNGLRKLKFIGATGWWKNVLISGRLWGYLGIIKFNPFFGRFWRKNQQDFLPFHISSIFIDHHGSVILEYVLLLQFYFKAWKRNKEQIIPPHLTQKVNTTNGPSTQSPLKAQKHCMFHQSNINFNVSSLTYIFTYVYIQRNYLSIVLWANKLTFEALFCPEQLETLLDLLKLFAVYTCNRVAYSKYCMRPPPIGNRWASSIELHVFSARADLPLILELTLNINFDVLLFLVRNAGWNFMGQNDLRVIQIDFCMYIYFDERISWKLSFSIRTNQEEFVSSFNFQPKIKINRFSLGNNHNFSEKGHSCYCVQA